MALADMNNSGLWLTSMTLSYELKPPDFMNISRMWMTRTTLGLELKAQDSINNARL